MALGLALCAVATALASVVSTLVAAEQFRLTLVLFAVGELLFLSPALIVGSFDLKLPDLPTASASPSTWQRSAATTMGVGLVAHFVGEREKFHSSFVTEHVSLYNPFNDYRVARLVEALPERSIEIAYYRPSDCAHCRAARREAWALAFADAFLVVAMLLLVSAFADVAMVGRPPLGIH